MTGEKKLGKKLLKTLHLNNLDSNEGQNPEVISNDKDHEGTVLSELTTSQKLQHLVELLEFSIAKIDETLSG